MENMRLLRDHGFHVRYQHEVLEGNARLEELQAAVLRLKLSYLQQQHIHMVGLTFEYNPAVNGLRRLSWPIKFIIAQNPVRFNSGLEYIK